MQPTQASFNPQSLSNDDGSEYAANNGKEEQLPFCSVLNTVVDHIMIPPTPLEVDEYQETVISSKSNVLVPVLRIFGPILRRDTTRSEAVLPPPAQTACLYVHNAFPYLLARPKWAGPDGSLHHSLGVTTDSTHIDWDSVSAVQHVVPVLQEAIEEAVHGLFQDPTDTSKKESSARAIRKVTVVEGRGFYSYCPGPPAPFLRIEYYDPTIRWKIKRVLERGLEDLPEIYFPDLDQYDYERKPEDTTDALQFHCFEAHIPYTMQFFKDYNLAGLLYVHVAEGQFRSPLPKGARCQSKVPVLDRHLFLDHNTPDEYLGDVLVEKNIQHELPSPLNDLDLRQPSQASDSTPSTIPSQTVLTKLSCRKQTTCDVELDICASKILNVNQMMREAGGEGVHWRAVPSLQEIWKEERRRMSRLLQAKDDFLSQKQHNLTISEKRSVSGTRLAVEGIDKLVGVTEGLKASFQRVLKQIVRRHALKIRKVDEALETEDAGVTMTPTEHEAIEALDGFDRLFEDSSSHDHPSDAIISESQPPDSSQDSAYDIETPQAKLMSLSQTFMESLDERVLSKESDATDIEEALDPKTLMPYDHPIEDEDNEPTSESEMEKLLTDLHTQRQDYSASQQDMETNEIEEVRPIGSEISITGSRNQSLATNLATGNESFALHHGATLVKTPPNRRQDILSKKRLLGLPSMLAHPAWLTPFRSHEYVARDSAKAQGNFTLVRRPPCRKADHRKEDGVCDEVRKRKVVVSFPDTPVEKKRQKHASSTGVVIDQLDGLGNQGGRLHVCGEGNLKARLRPTQQKPVAESIASSDQYLPAPVTIMIVEVHVQCRQGQAGSNNTKTIALTPDPDRDVVQAVVFVLARDPGGGEALETIERGCIFLPVDRDVGTNDKEKSAGATRLLKQSMPPRVFGIDCPFTVECARSERQLLLRLASIVKWKDPSMLLSWDTQGLGLGYLIERGVAMGKEGEQEIDLVKLLGRSIVSTRSVSSISKSVPDLPSGDQDRWKGSGLGTEWDDRVGAGAAAASIVSDFKRTIRLLKI